MDKDIYQRAESFLPWNLQKSVYNSTLFPYWTDEALYYFDHTVLGKSLLKHDIHTGKKEKMFDYPQLMALYSDQLGQLRH